MGKEIPDLEITSAVEAVIDYQRSCGIKRSLKVNRSFELLSDPNVHDKLTDQQKARLFDSSLTFRNELF